MSTTSQHISQPASDHPDAGVPGEPAVVVIGLDGSASSWDAFWWGCGEATRLHGRAIAVYVSPLAATAPAAAAAAAASGFPICDYQAFEVAATEQAAELRADALRQVAGQPLDLTFIHACGDPAQELLRISRAVQASVIAIGRSTKLRHRIAGSLGRRLITRPRAPLIVIVP
jgi:nucleotide-binding universal stress UspA family protein